MDLVQNNKILREEALKRVQKSDILHSSGLVNAETTAAGGASMTYQQRQEMLKKYVGDYDRSKLGSVRNPAMRAQAVPQKQGSRFDALIRRRGRRP